MASDRLMEVEQLVARTDSEALAAMQRHADRLKEIEERERKELEVGKGNVDDVSEITLNRLEVEAMLKKAKEARPSPDVAVLERRLSEVERKLDQIQIAIGETAPRPEAAVVIRLNTGRIANLPRCGQLGSAPPSGGAA